MVVSGNPLNYTEPAKIGFATMRTSSSTSCFLCVVLATLFVLSSSISSEEIESRVIKNDCYERMAIGHRLNSKDVYKTTNSSSAVECKKVCTEEKLSCKSFSFGIDDKNETVCELNKNPIKETGDLKPIGTVPNEDFDLYIKKLDCTIVIDDEKLPSPIKNPYPKPPNDSYSASQQNKPIAVIPGKPHDSVEHVQTVVSIATGPQKPVLHPTLDILVGEGPYSYARPPFRPPFLNHPYERPLNNPRPEYRPIDYEHRPIIIRPESYYEKPWKPSDYNDRPPIRPGGYDEGPLRPDRPWRPSGYEKPSRPGGYDDRPMRPGDYDERPMRPSYEERPIRPSYEEKPIRPSYEEKPIRPSYDERPLRPSYDGRPDGYDERPQIPTPRPGGYEERPIKPEDKPPRPSDYDQKPIRPTNYDERPRPGGYEERPAKPNEYDLRPIKPRPPFLHEKPSRPDDYDERPSRPQRPIGPPGPDYDQRPSRPPLDYGYGRPPNSYNEIRPQRPYHTSYQSSGYYYPHYQDYFEPSYHDNDKFYRPIPERYGSYIPRPDDYDYYRPTPIKDYLFNEEIDRYDTKPGYIQDKPHGSKPDPDNPNINHEYNRPSKPKPSYPTNNEIQGTSTNKPKEPHPKPIVTQTLGPHGETITSIIQEWDKKEENNKACFRRVLAGKRVARGFVKRALICERVEDCHRECADESRFLCEGFNYRLDPTGHGKGECELLDVPLFILDIGRDIYPDIDYDYYDRDRNAQGPSCDKGNYPNRGGNRYDGNNYYDRRNDYDYDRRPQRPYDEDRRPGYDRGPPVYGPPRRPSGYDDGYRPNGNRRGDFAYNHHSPSHHSQENYEHSQNYYNHYHGAYYSPQTSHYPSTYDYNSYEPYLPPDRRPPPNYDDDKYYTNRRDKNHWGFNQNSWGSYGGSYGTYGNYNRNTFDRRNYYLPPKVGGSNDWGQYGGTYGTGGHNVNGYGNNHHDYWGVNKYEDRNSYGETLPPYKKPFIGSYLPEPPYKPPRGGSYLPEPPYKPPRGDSYLPKPPTTNVGSYLPKPPVSGGSYLPKPHHFDNSILPAEPRHPPYNYIKDECSLRTATGFRLHKGIVKKFFAVPDIYECELLCFKEKDFPCASYAYRYTVSSTAPTDNCYLSNRNYKELDFYTDLQPDRAFDIYTMNNQNNCQQPIIKPQEDSECFFRVRSAQRLDHKVVRDSLTVKSIVECQLECLRSSRFTCRAFSFRYGSPVIGGVIDNCQLTDWPFYDLDPRIHLLSEPGFELYERGSYGHGCEPNPFGTMGRPWKDPEHQVDQLCYVGFGTPARLLPQATRKALTVTTELECKSECSKLREGTLLQCMSFSYRAAHGDREPNCLLSDILQRDLLPNVDYIPDEHSWLFAWDNYNPECIALSSSNSNHGNHIGHGSHGGDFHDRIGYDPTNAVGTWRVYSVSGWPCRRGSTCQENREAGFWFCELEGGDHNAWDYCCRPDHQCGSSEGFPYQWCYVGPTRTQWRKCSDRYYPYLDHAIADRFDERPSHFGYLPSASNIAHFGSPPPPPYRPGLRPDRPPAPPPPPTQYPSLDDYEMQFQSQFLDPPRPGGFGQSRHWPLSYLHKEMPPNNTDSDSRLMKAAKMNPNNPKFAAIQNLIDVIKSNDLKNIQYQITNESNKRDDILFVKIPLPTNFTQETRKMNMISLNSTSSISGPIDLTEDAKNTTNTKRSQKSLSVLRNDRTMPIYRKSYITRTNITNHSRGFRNIRSIKTNYSS